MVDNAVIIKATPTVKEPKRASRGELKPMM